MKYWLDTEFIECPCTIDLISIGIVAEDGRELYHINADCDHSKASPWVADNVLAQLPIFTFTDPRWLNHTSIEASVLDFIDDDIPEFWAYYADYDWVVFCWLFGSMINLPKGWPMYCRDIKQWADQLGNPELPKQRKGSHNALEDAHWNKKAWQYLDNLNRLLNYCEPAES